MTENAYSIALSVLVPVLLLSAYKVLEWSRKKLQETTVDFPIPKPSSQSHPCPNENLTSLAFIGLDCEMVGTGRGGYISLLARCSIVTVKDDGKIHVVYDKIVRPTKKVTDYRTKYSGITKELLEGKTVSFEKCQNEVNEIFASYEGKQCVVVGHALRNDFDVLKIRYPSYLVRDTAKYPRFMRSGRRSQKLRHLVYEHLGQRIQGSAEGHSSVEDAAAVLMLYRKFQAEWEKSLRYPLNKLEARKLQLHKSVKKKKKTKWQPIKFYLDGCNLPVGLRQNSSDGKYALLSKKEAQRKGRSNIRTLAQIDWIPIFRAMLASNVPAISKVILMFDGASFKSRSDQISPGKKKIYTDIHLEVTEVGVEADDVLVKYCTENIPIQSQTPRGEIVSVDEVIALFEKITGDLKLLSYAGIAVDQNIKSDELEKYVVVKRVGGGTKTNKNLFEKLNLRRPHEGALCLTGLTGSLLKRSLQIAKELKRARVSNLVQYEIRERQDVRSVVFTDDVLLADRVVQEGGIVLSNRQMQDFEH